MTGSGFGEGRDRFPYFRVGLELMRNAVAVSSEQTYLGHFGAWVDFRVSCAVPVFLQHCREDIANVWCLFEYVANSFATKLLRSATIKSHLSAIKYFHRTSRGFELDTTHPIIASVLKGAARSHANVGNQATVRKPISWWMFLAGEALITSWRSGSQIMLLTLCASFCYLTHASEMFAETRSRTSESYCLRRADVALFRGEAQLAEALWSTAHRVVVCFRISKGDQLRISAVLSRVREGTPRPVGAGGAPSIL